jgi:hypothetical protein
MTVDVESKAKELAIVWLMTEFKGDGLFGVTSLVWCIYSDSFRNQGQEKKGVA